MSMILREKLIMILLNGIANTSLICSILDIFSKLIISMLGKAERMQPYSKRKFFSFVSQSEDKGNM